MEIKKGAELIADSDFWYDLIDGGYIDPKKVLVDPKDAEKVLEAIEVLREFQQVYDDACDDQEED